MLISMLLEIYLFSYPAIGKGIREPREHKIEQKNKSKPNFTRTFLAYSQFTDKILEKIKCRSASLQNILHVKNFSEEVSFDSILATIFKKYK